MLTSGHPILRNIITVAPKLYQLKRHPNQIIGAFNTVQRSMRVCGRSKRSLSGACGTRSLVNRDSAHQYNMEVGGPPLPHRHVSCISEVLIGLCRRPHIISGMKNPNSFVHKALTLSARGPT